MATFAVGSKVTVKAKGGVKTTSTLTRGGATEDMEFGLESFPGLTLTSDHVIENPPMAKTVLTERGHHDRDIRRCPPGRLLSKRLEEALHCGPPPT